MKNHNKAIADKLLRIYQLDQAEHSIMLITRGVADIEAAKRSLREECARLAGEVNALLAEMPPVPPADSLDGRWRTGKL